jgi:hypothetical protein
MSEKRGEIYGSIEAHGGIHRRRSAWLRVASCAAAAICCLGLVWASGSRGLGSGGEGGGGSAPVSLIADKALEGKVKAAFSALTKGPKSPEAPYTAPKPAMVGGVAGWFHPAPQPETDEESGAVAMDNAPAEPIAPVTIPPQGG